VRPVDRSNVVGSTSPFASGAGPLGLLALLGLVGPVGADPLCAGAGTAAGTTTVARSVPRPASDVDGWLSGVD
jgi:hypothetical protein